MPNFDFQTTLNDALQYNSPHDAVRVLSYVKKNPSTSIDDETKAKLSYIRLSSLYPDQLLELMGRSLLVAYKIPGFLLSEKLLQYGDGLLDPAEEVSLYKKIVEIIEDSNEVFGSSSMTLSNKNSPVTIGSLIKEYDAFYTQNNEHDALMQMKFINTSTNAKSMNPSDRAVFQDILKIYDRALSMSQFWDSLEVPKDQKELYKDYDLYQLIPDLVEDKELAEFAVAEPIQPPTASEPPAKPVAPTTPTTPTKPAAPEISTVMPDNLPSLKAPVAEASVDAPKTSTPKAIDLVKPAAPQTTVHLKQPTAPFDAKGLTFTDGHSVQAIEEQQKVVERRRLAASEELKKEEEIERKLAALKNRNKPNSK